MAASNNTSATPQNGQNGQQGFDDQKVRQESAQAAEKSLAAQQKAHELKEAARGAADPEERQKLLEEALDKEVEAESFGKTAKYLRTGTFQGLAVGSGLGAAPGATLGAITGTLVGGLTSTILGGLGGAIGAGVGWLHGPWFNVGETMGKNIQKITGNLPGWKATDEQKKTLETMITQAREQDMPKKDELEQLKSDNGKTSWSESAAAMVPSWGSWGKSKKDQGTSGNAKSSGEHMPGSSRGQEVRRADDQGVARLAAAQARNEAARHNPQAAPKQAPQQRSDSPSAAASTSKPDVSKPRQPVQKAAQRQTKQSSQQTTQRASGRTQQQPSRSAQPPPRQPTQQVQQPSQGAQQPERKKPRKLEMRGNPVSQTEQESKPVQPARKKPRKLETRSNAIKAA